jgi:hypothetical protein
LTRRVNDRITTMRFATRGQYLAGVAIAVLSASAASSEIFPPVTIGGVYQQMTGTLSYAPPDDLACNPVGLCYAVFGRVPVGKQLIVTHASCRLIVSQGGAPGNIAAASLLPQLPNDALLPHQQQLQAVRNHEFSFAVSGTVLLPFAARQRPLIAITAGAGPAAVINGICSIAGQISDAP